MEEKQIQYQGINNNIMLNGPYYKINNLNNIQQNPPNSFYGNSSLNQVSGKFSNMVPSSFNVPNSHFSQGQNQFR